MANVRGGVIITVTLAVGACSIPEFVLSSAPQQVAPTPRYRTYVIPGRKTKHGQRQDRIVVEREPAMESYGDIDSSIQNIQREIDTIRDKARP